MGVLTTLLKLLKPGENDYYNQQTEQADNWQKVDDYAVYTDRDKNAIWGGLDGGGLIEDPTVVKEVGKRYIGADGKAYICLVPSNINNSTNYMPCNAVDNLDKLQNLIKEEIITLELTFESGYELVYKHVLAAPKNILSVFPSDISNCSSETGWCRDNYNVIVSATKSSPDIGTPSRTITCKIKYI